MTKSVLILGSKPQCTVPEQRFDVVYAANGALLRAHTYAPNAHVISVVSRDYAMAYHAKARADLPKMAAARFNEVLVIGAFQLQAFAPAFREFAGDRPITKRTALRRTRDIIDYLSWPVMKRVANMNGGLVAMSWRLALKHELSVWKPSAGFYASTLALERFGPDADVHVSGVGLQSDGLYNQEKSRGRSHIQIDTQLYHKLTAKGVQFHDVNPKTDVAPPITV